MERKRPAAADHFLDDCAQRRPRCRGDLRTRRSEILEIGRRPDQVFASPVEGQLVLEYCETLTGPVLARPRLEVVELLTGSLWEQIECRADRQARRARQRARYFIPIWEGLPAPTGVDRARHCVAREGPEHLQRRIALVRGGELREARDAVVHQGRVWIGDEQAGEGAVRISFQPCSGGYGALLRKAK